MNIALLHTIQLALLALILCLAASALGTSAHTIDVYRKQRSDNPWWLPLWPEHFDVNGTKTLISSSVAVLILDGSYFLLAVTPRFQYKTRSTFRLMLALGFGLPLIFITLCATVYAHILNHNAPDLDTIQTWTCRLKSQNPETAVFPIAPNMSNAGFKQLCSESRFALYAIFIVLFLQIGITILAIVTWAADLWARRKANKEWKDTSSLEGNTTQ